MFHFVVVENRAASVITLKMALLESLSLDERRSRDLLLKGWCP